MLIAFSDEGIFKLILHKWRIYNIYYNLLSYFVLIDVSLSNIYSIFTFIAIDFWNFHVLITCSKLIVKNFSVDYALTLKNWNCLHSMMSGGDDNCETIIKKSANKNKTTAFFSSSFSVHGFFFFFWFHFSTTNTVVPLVIFRKWTAAHPMPWMYQKGSTTISG